MIIFLIFVYFVVLFGILVLHFWMQHIKHPWAWAQNEHDNDSILFLALGWPVTVPIVSFLFCVAFIIVSFVTLAKVVVTGEYQKEWDALKEVFFG